MFHLKFSLPEGRKPKTVCGSFMLFFMDIVHNREQKRFEVALEGGGVAELSYALSPDTMSITHTYVPDAARGQGVAGRMTQAALEYARAHDSGVIPICSYAAAYLARQRRSNP